MKRLFVCVVNGEIIGVTKTLYGVLELIEPFENDFVCNIIESELEE